MTGAPRFFEDTPIYRRHMADGRMPYPDVIQFEVTSECNLRCIMCPLSSDYRERADDERLFSLEQVKKLDDLWDHATEIELTGFGEIFTHPEIVEILRYLRTRGLALYGSSNGQLLTPALSETIVGERLLDILCFSIDAATGPTYRRIRRGGRWDRLLTNLGALRAAKERAGSAAPILFFSFAAMRRNIAELPDFVRMAHRFGGTKVIVQHVVENRLTRGQRLPGDLASVRSHLDAAQAAADELGIDLDMRNLDPVEDGPARHVEDGVLPTPAAFKQANRLVKDCPFPWEHIFLKSNYEVQICAILWEEMVMGNLRETPFDAIWNGPGYEKLRFQMCGTDAPEECVYCYFKGWRRPTPIDRVRPAVAMDHDDAGQFGRGWHLVEQVEPGRFGRWAKKDATLFLKNDGSPQLAVEMYEHADGPFLSASVYANDQQIGRVTSHDLWGAPVLLAIPPSDDEFLEIAFRFDEAWQPGERVGMVGKRWLTALFYRAGLTGERKPLAPRIVPGEDDRSQLGLGWFAPLDALGARACWTADRAQVILPAGRSDVLRIEAAIPDERADRSIDVTANGETAGRIDMVADGLYREYAVPLPACAARYRVVELAFNGVLPDGTGDRTARPLGALVRRVELGRRSVLSRLLKR